MTFGERVFHRRHELGLSQTDVANALDVTVATINKIEHGRTKPTSKTAKKVAKLLKMDEEVDAINLIGNIDLDLAMLEKRVNNAIFELQCILDTIHKMKGETNEQNT